MRKTALSLCMLLLLSACGIKPEFVDPPQGHEHDQFPKTYPDPSTLRNMPKPETKPAAE